jgi:hypothetical protein
MGRTDERNSRESDAAVTAARTNAEGGMVAHPALGFICTTARAVGVSWAIPLVLTKQPAGGR